jgi:hypothetical protein
MHSTLFEEIIQKADKPGGVYRLYGKDQPDGQTRTDEGRKLSSKE